MKKIFTLIAMAAMAIGANAQVWKVNADTPTAENSTWLDDDLVTVKTTFAGTVKESAATIAGEEFTHYAQVRVDAAPTAAVPQGTDKGGSTSLIITPKKDVTYTIYYRRQAGDWTSNDGKDVKVIDQADAGTVLEAEMTIDSKTEDGNYGLAMKVVSLKAGKTYTVWARGTTLNYYGMKFEAAGGEQGGGQGQGGGEQPSGEVEKYVAAPDGKLAAEFAAVVDGENATNVVDGKSVVTITTANVTVEAVGGATPANVDGGSQDITPGSVVDAEKHPTVRPPLLGGNERVGVWASRSPFRPNNLGLSSVRINSIDLEHLTIEVLGADLMDGTPIYDIKPYLPYADSHPEARGGFTDKRKWKRLQVSIPDEVCHVLPEKDVKVLIEALSLDPRPHYQSDANRQYGMPFMGYDIRFHVADGCLYVDDFVEK